MLEAKRVAVVVPAHNEEELIVATLQGIPGFVDHVYVVDDASTDETAERARSVDDPRIEVIVHERNRGVGAAIVTGYKRALAERHGRDRGDGRRQPDGSRRARGARRCPSCVASSTTRRRTGSSPAARGRSSRAAATSGNAVLSFLTKIASGYWHVADSQAGYTVLSLRMLRLLDLDRIYTSYGFPNDMLVHLNVWNARVRDFPSRPIYGVGERSGIKIRRVVPRISWLLWKGFFWRLREKYVIRDFHPLVFFYALGFLMMTVGFAPRRRRDRAPHPRARDPGSDDRARRAAPHLGQPVHAVRDVVRHGVEQGPALTRRLGRREAKKLERKHQQPDAGRGEAQRRERRQLDA